MDLDGDEVKCTVKKIKADGNYLVEDEEGTVYQCEPQELKPAKGKKAAPVEDDEDDEEDKPAPKKKKAAPVEEDDTDDSDDSDDSDDEKPAPKKNKKIVDEDESEEDSGKMAAKSKAPSWNKAKPAQQSAVGLPVGNWEALAYTGACVVEGKGIQAYIEYVGVHDDDVNGKTQRAYYTLKDDKGVWTEGTTYFKRDLITLGFEEEDLEVADDSDDEEFAEAITKILKKLRKREPWVSIKIKDGKGGYTRLFLNGLMDDQDDKPENPLAK